MTMFQDDLMSIQKWPTFLGHPYSKLSY